MIMYNSGRAVNAAAYFVAYITMTHVDTRGYYLVVIEYGGGRSQ